MSISTRNLVRKRKQAGKPNTIIRNTRGLVTKKNISRVINRWSKRKGFVAKSYDKVISDSKNKGRFYEITTVQVATRLALKDLMKGITIPLNSRQKKLIERLIMDRPQKIPTTNINLRPDKILFILELINSLGEKKTHQIINSVFKRSKALQRMAQQESLKRDIPSDAFINVSQNVGAIALELEINLLQKEQTIGQINDFISQRRGDLNFLQNSNIKNKEFYIQKLRLQMKEAIMEKIKFQINNNLPI